MSNRLPNRYFPKIDVGCPWQQTDIRDKCTFGCQEKKIRERTSLPSTDVCQCAWWLLQDLVSQKYHLENRGYYIAARRYEISPRVLKNISRVNAHEKRNFLSAGGHVMLYLLHKHQWDTEPFHFNICWLKRRHLLSSNSNSDLSTCKDIMFSRESSPGISLVFIY